MFLTLNQAKTQTHSKLLNEALSEVFFNANLEMVIDSLLQEKYKDTIQKIQIEIHGFWHYQGISRNRYEKDLVDTLFWSSVVLSGEQITTFVKNGDVFKLKNGKIIKTDSIATSFFDFSNPSLSIGIKELEKIGTKGAYFSARICQPFYSIV